MQQATILIVPGLREHVPGHWQTLFANSLAAAGQPVRSVAPMGRANLDCGARVAAIEAAAQSIEGPVILVAHSGGCIMAAHWAQRSTRPVHGALLAAPPDFERPMPDGFPSLDELDAAGWLPVPRERLPFRSIVACSSNDPLAHVERALDLAQDWGSAVVALGAVGHLNPASGFGPWPQADELVQRLRALP
jgi:predicted alpha/beta hydrolase family esterase